MVEWLRVDLQKQKQVRLEGHCCDRKLTCFTSSHCRVIYDSSAAIRKGEGERERETDFTMGGGGPAALWADRYLTCCTFQGQGLKCVTASADQCNPYREGEVDREIFDCLSITHIHRNVENYFIRIMILKECPKQRKILFVICTLRNYHPLMKSLNLITRAKGSKVISPQSPCVQSVTLCSPSARAPRINGSPSCNLFICDRRRRRSAG